MDVQRKIIDYLIDVLVKSSSMRVPFIPKNMK